MGPVVILQLRLEFYKIDRICFLSLSLSNQEYIINILIKIYNTLTNARYKVIDF